MLNRERFLRLCDVVVVALEPFASDADLVGHRVQFVISVGDHVRHDIAAPGRVARLELGFHVVDIDGHF